MESNLRSFASRMDSRTTQMEAHAYIRRVYRQLLSIEYAGEDEDDEEMDESGHVSDADMTVE